MGDPIKLAQCMPENQDNYESEKRPVYTCSLCRKTKEREAGDFKTAECTSCGSTMRVHFEKDPTERAAQKPLFFIKYFISFPKYP